MSAVTLVLQDLYPNRASPEAPALPRLAALERWIARAVITPSPRGWRAALAEGAGAESYTEGGAAAGAAGALPDPTRGYWLATPVHLLAGLDTLRLHPAGLLTTSLEEQCALAAEFAQVFRGSGWALRATQRRELLLEGPPAEGITTQDPARFLGRAVREGVPQGVGAAALRRLMSEIEMWLHEHPVNGRRLAAGQLPISGLWLWGGGEAASERARRLPPLYGDDLAAEALWKLAGAPIHSLPSDWAALPNTRERGAVLIVAVDSGAGAEALQRLERDWIAPLLAHALRGRGEAALLCADKRFTLTGRARWKLWRRERPWWEAL